MDYDYMISVTRAKEIITALAKRLPHQQSPLAGAAGLVLAEDVSSPLSIPAYPQSGMDGYALNFEGNFFSRKLVGEMAAGSNHEFTLGPREAVRIFTGAAVPAGANTVLMQEKARVEDGALWIEDPNLVAGANVRPEGSEVALGELALVSGTVLTPAAIGFLAGMGITEVATVRLPKISVIVTGNELQVPGQPLGYGQVYEANSYSLVAALAQSGINPIGIYRCADDPVQLAEILTNALEESDAVLMTGGVSVGDYDFTSLAFDACGLKKIFHKIKQKPGKPILFGMGEHQLVFGLPGNPASVLTCYYQYVLPALGIMSGLPISLPVQEARLRNAYKKPAGLTHFLKGYWNNGEVELMSGQESYKLNSFARANCLAEIPEEATELAEGSGIKVHLFK